MTPAQKKKYRALTSVPEWRIIGRHAHRIALDEGNFRSFRLESNLDLKAYKLYDEVRTRIRNRFQKRDQVA